MKKIHFFKEFFKFEDLFRIKNITILEAEITFVVRTKTKLNCS